MSTYLNAPQGYIPDGAMPSVGSAGNVCAVALASFTCSGSATFTAASQQDTGGGFGGVRYDGPRQYVRARVSIALPGFSVRASGSASTPNLTDEESALFVLLLDQLQEAA